MGFFSKEIECSMSWCGVPELDKDTKLEEARLSECSVFLAGSARI